MMWKQVYKRTRQIKNRGFTRTLQSFITIIQDWWFDFKLGINTGELEYLKNLDIKSNYREGKKNRRYQATRVRAFQKLLNKLALSKENVLVDLGAGKGRVLLLAMEYGFNKVVGVEFSSILCQIARKNIEIYQKNHITNTEVKIIESDVVDYGIQDDETVYFLFNPFNDYVMGIYLNKLRNSLLRKDREVWIIFNNPIHHQLISSQDFIEKYCTFMYGGSNFHVYVHRVLAKN